MLRSDAAKDKNRAQVSCKTCNPPRGPTPDILLLSKSQPQSSAENPVAAEPDDVCIRTARASETFCRNSSRTLQNPLWEIFPRRLPQLPTYTYPRYPGYFDLVTKAQVHNCFRIFHHLHHLHSFTHEHTRNLAPQGRSTSIQFGPAQSHARNTSTMGFIERIQAKIELLRLEKRYTRSRHRRSTFVSNAIYVDGEYIYQSPNTTGSSASTSRSGSSLGFDVSSAAATRQQKKMNRWSSMPGFGSGSKPDGMGMPPIREQDWRNRVSFSDDRHDRY
ncbi:hypothetical protein VTJ83DRAFT_2843 [Remersonia thermophila]|uniref:Uncharacterized protein n=1 Tax=Remersonia thermophila TaxID=72144 RepID=A0ABR4DCB8_9PEZI